MLSPFITGLTSSCRSIRTIRDAAGACSAARRSAPANPTPIRYFLSAGVGGDSHLRAERGVTFGIGWYHTVASDEFGPIPRAALDPRNGTGVELYDNFQVTPWMNVTPDIQFIRPGNRAIANDAVIYGLRMVMTL